MAHGIGPKRRVAMASDVPRPPSGAENNALPAERSEVGMLFHRLNNQLGIILASAELLEGKSESETSRARANQIVVSVVEAIATARDIQSCSRTPNT